MTEASLQDANSRLWRGHPHGNGTVSTQANADNPVLPQLRRRLQSSASEDFEVRSSQCDLDVPCRVLSSATPIRMLPRMYFLQWQHSLACSAC